jgi:diaminopimelate decarboxylase
MNAVGWERFETEFSPVINLSRPDTIEHKSLVMGSLCTPHDVWGYGYFGQRIEVGDVLLIPQQGAYTYSLRQEFIKPLPKVVCIGLETEGRVVQLADAQNL